MLYGRTIHRGIITARTNVEAEIIIEYKVECQKVSPHSANIDAELDRTLKK